MAKTRCVFLITIITFASFILQIFSTKFPEFLNEDDLRSMGVKNPQKKVYHPPSVKREPESPPPGYESVESNEMNKNRKPPNGLPIPAVPPPFYTYKNSEFKPMGRGDPKDQNIVQQMDDEDGNALFPRPDGLPLSGSDSIDLNLLEKRLTDTNKWDEFRNLVAKEQQKLKQGETMENWEADAHMWASYSRQLVERDKIAKRRAQEEERKDAERKAARQNQHEYLNPSAGMEQYWTSNDNDKKSSDPRYEMDAVNKKMLETLSRLPHSQSDSEGQGITGLDTALSGTDKGRGPGAYSSGPEEYLKGRETYPGGAGGFPGSLGGFPGSTGRFPGNSGFPGSAAGYPGGAGEYPGGAGGYPGGAGGYPGGAGGYPGGTGRFPGGAGGYPGGPGGHPGGAGGYPGVAGGNPGGAGGYTGGAEGYPGGAGGYPGGAGGYPGGPGGYPGGAGGYPEGAEQFPGGSERYSGDPRGFPGGPGGFPQGPGRFPGGAAGFPGGAGVYPGGAAGAAIPGAPEAIPGGAGGFPRDPGGFPGDPGGFPGDPGGFPEGPGTYPKGSGSILRSPEAFSGGPGERGNKFKFPAELSLSKNAQLWHAMKQGIHLPMPPPKLWTRRQYDGMPPIYYKDRPNESRGAISTGRDDRYLTPEQRSQESPDYDMGPDTSQLSQTFEKPRITFDENVNEDNVPYGDGKIPGVGSEADFPNGYRPNYGDNSQISPGFYQMPQSYSSGYPEAQKNPFIKTQPKTRSNKAPPQIPPKNKAAVGYPDDFKHALRMGGPRFQPGPGSESDFSEGSGPDNFKHALRMGGPHSQPGLGSESNFPEGSGPDNFKHALRMGGPRFQPGPGSELNVPEGSSPNNYKYALQMGGPRFQPGPGSESDFSEGFHPKIAGGNMERGVPSGNGLHRPPRLNNQFQGMGQRGPPPGWHSEGKAGWKPDKSWGSSRFSPPGEPDYQPLPESERLQPNFPREFPVKGKDGPAALRDGADDTAITFQGQNSPGGDADLGQAGFKPRQPNLPTGYNLLQIALNKTADEDQMIRAAPTTEPSTTPKHPPTKEERIQQLQQHDDFGAPIRWVPLTSPDTSDGLAKVTDKETHKNQQFIIEGVLYVPVVDENVARLGLTTEDYQETTTQLPTLTPKNDSSIKTILRSMNLNKSSELEWLAMETVLGPKQIYPAQCEAESCQARCHKPKCDSKCAGEMCASGCVGVGCNANCNGPACFSMCIGEKCTAKCEGMNCESRCWGKGCEATCTLLSCIYTVNGETLVTNATFDQLYPNYDNKPKNDGRQAQRLEQPGLDNTKLKNEDYYY